MTTVDPSAYSSFSIERAPMPRAAEGDFAFLEDLRTLQTEGAPIKVISPRIEIIDSYEATYLQKCYPGLTVAAVRTAVGRLHHSRTSSLDDFMTGVEVGDVVSRKLTYQTHSGFNVLGLEVIDKEKVVERDRLALAACLSLVAETEVILRPVEEIPMIALAIFYDDDEKGIEAVFESIDDHGPYSTDLSYVQVRREKPRVTAGAPSPLPRQ